MFIIKGKIKKDDINEFTKKGGTTVQKRIIFLEPEGSIFPIKIYIDDRDLDLGKIGDTISLDVNVYPYYFLDKKVRRANVNFYVSNKE
jgi:hypothetical protein